MKKLSEYSQKNQQLIRSQCPGATLLAGAKEWERAGAEIKPGAKPILIWAPKLAPDGTVQGWTEVQVFDISQVTFNSTHKNLH